MSSTSTAKKCIVVTNPNPNLLREFESEMYVYQSDISELLLQTLNRRPIDESVLHTATREYNLPVVRRVLQDLIYQISEILQDAGAFPRERPEITDVYFMNDFQYIYLEYKHG